MTTYRDEIRRLDRLATPDPWVSEGELYGVIESDLFTPLGFAPHRPSDGRLIAVYRSAVMQLLDAMDAVERLVSRAGADPTVPVAIGIRQVLVILDSAGGGAASFRRGLVDLDHVTTPPLWDPGHLSLGMDFGAEVPSLGIATPKPGDAPLIAASRIAVPRAVSLLADVEVLVAQHGFTDGRMRGEGVLAIARALAAFDNHSAAEGVGTGTV